MVNCCPIWSHCSQHPSEIFALKTCFEGQKHFPTVHGDKTIQRRKASLPCRMVALENRIPIRQKYICTRAVVVAQLLERLLLTLEVRVCHWQIYIERAFAINCFEKMPGMAHLKNIFNFLITKVTRLLKTFFLNLINALSKSCYWRHQISEANNFFGPPPASLPFIFGLFKQF